MSQSESKKKAARKKSAKRISRKTCAPKRPVLKKDEKGRGIWVICHKCRRECEAGEWECDGGPYVCLKCLGRAKRNTLYINVKGEGE